MSRCRPEILVVGSGPAGLSAALEAAGFGASVIVVDENDTAGGQLFKQIHKFFGSARHKAGMRGIDIGRALLREVERLDIELHLRTTAVGVFDGEVALVRDEEELEVLRPARIILATGAMENPLSFPGWTLPGVITAGAAQTFINIHRVSVGERVLMVGSGNVGLIVAYQMMQAGCEVAAVVEARPEIGGWGVHASKIRRMGCQIYTSCTVKQACGQDRVSRVTLQDVDGSFRFVPGTERELDVDTVCIAAGLSPRAELARMIGCSFLHVPDLGGFMPLHGANMETSHGGVYIAGDIAGVEEASSAMEEGRLAGLSAAASLGYVCQPVAERRKREIAESLAALRMGPLAQDRAVAKRKVVGAYEQR
ncbi:MAG: FAD-dependent oxidoreductase [Spirochaetaceae bacterium]|nr:MAG: FAD-dependent oxidoreductase [Spirochaetaceae bacterium]